MITRVSKIHKKTLWTQTLNTMSDVIESTLTKRKKMLRSTPCETWKILLNDEWKGLKCYHMFNLALVSNAHNFHFLPFPTWIIKVFLDSQNFFLFFFLIYWFIPWLLYSLFIHWFLNYLFLHLKVYEYSCLL